MPFAYVAAAVAVIGAATSAYASYSQGQQAKDAENYNAEVARNNAIAAGQQAQQNALLQQQQAAKTIGAQVAGYGSSGVDVGSGSALDILGNSASNAELDKQTILYKGQLQSVGYTDEAQLDASKGANAAADGMARGASQLLMGVGDAYSKLPASKPSAQSNTDTSAGGNYGSDTGPGTGGLY